MMDCPCFLFEEDPEAVAADGVVVCACGHVDDEHDEHGDCEAEIVDGD